MKTIVFASVGLMFASTAALARCDRYGNCYDSYGSHTNGSNYNTGSQWNSQSYGGSTYGTDARGNNWSYDRGSNVYQNYGTGRTCSGSGVYRSCY